MRKLIVLLLLLAAAPLLADDFTASVDKAVNEILTKTGAPSASVAVVRDGKLVYANAYGLAKLEPKTPATPQMRYSIGSISKQFTAAAILMLAEEGKLSLDDKVVRWLPELTRAKDVTIRQLLSMTSGYQDFWPQDYVMPGMLEPATPQQITDAWAKKPLDFEPGTRWQYSNTNYVIAGMIFERAAGMPLVDFLRQRVFAPLQMTSVFNTDVAPLPDGDPARYLRYALGPPRPAPKEGKGWMFAAGELAMTAQDLAKWDIAMINESLLQPASYREMEREVLLAGGNGTHYGLGVSVNTVDGRRLISHGGEVSGFTAQNQVYPDQRAAVVVLTNLDATSASEQIATKVAQLVFTATDDAALAQARAIFEGLQHGRIDRALFTSNANAYFSEQALKDFASSLGPLGTPQEFTQTAQSLRGGMTLRRYRVKFANKTLRAWTFAMPDGKLEQFMVAAVE
ncbi:MAG TPA: serine hydrolase domain-containing protein [Thermoanaerobaculia bacterium]|nr:serine hydrolase domain-containing protein [Thermoanaerobaculia bacterium]